MKNKEDFNQETAERDLLEKDISESIEYDEWRAREYGELDVDTHWTAKHLYDKGWRNKCLETPNTPNTFIIKDTAYITCKCCNHAIRTYDLSIYMPDAEAIKQSIEVNKDNIYPYYCENCGVKLK